MGGAWAVHINQYGRVAALVLLTAFALTLLTRRLAELLARPFIALGNRLTQGSSPIAHHRSGHRVAVGAVRWAHPRFGFDRRRDLGPEPHTTLLLVCLRCRGCCFVSHSAVGRGPGVCGFEAWLGAGEWVRRGLGLAVLVGVAAIALGLDSGLLTRVSLAHTDSIEQTLIGQIRPPTQRATEAVGTTVANKSAPGSLPVEGQLPALSGATNWLQLAAAHPRRAAGEGCTDRFLDLFVHQLLALAPLYQWVVREVQGPWAGGDWGSLTGVCFEKDLAREARGTRPQYRLSGCVG